MASHSVTPVSPKYGFGFDGQECDVVRVRKARPCDGGRTGRGSVVAGAPHAPDCTGWVEPGDVAVLTIETLFVSDTTACVPCALAVGAIRPVD